MSPVLEAPASPQPVPMREDLPWSPPQDVPRSVLGRPHTACIYFELSAAGGAASRQRLQQLFSHPQAEPFVHLALSSADGVATVGHQTRSQSAALAASMRELLADVGATVVDVRHGP